MKRLIAFSSIAHMGFVMLGIATLTDFGINAAIFGMVAHGLITGMLFFVAGSVQERYETREISRLGGLLTQAPQLGWILGFCAMASLGLPGLAGFWGEFPAILSAYDPTKLADGLFGGSAATLWTFRTFMVIAAIGTVLAAGYLLWMLQRVAFGKPKAEFENAHIHDVHVPRVDRVGAAAASSSSCSAIYPDLLFSLTDGAVAHDRQGLRGWIAPSMNPSVDFHAFAPEIVLTAAIVVVPRSSISSPSGRAGRSSAHREHRRARRR